MSDTPPVILPATEQASYEIVSIIDKPVVNKGGEIKIDLFFTGDGLEPVNSKLYINFGGLSLDTEDPGKIVTGVDARPVEELPDDRNKQDISEKDDFAIVLGPEAADGNVRRIESEEFAAIHTIGRQFFLNKSTGWSTKYDPILSEVSHGGFAPISVELNLADGVQSGDYEITYTLTYGNDSLVKQSKATDSIHVNNKVEQYRFYIVGFGLVLTLGALLVDIPLADMLDLFPDFEA